MMVIALCAMKLTSISGSGRSGRGARHVWRRARTSAVGLVAVGQSCAVAMRCDRCGCVVRCGCFLADSVFRVGCECGGQAE